MRPCGGCSFRLSSSVAVLSAPAADGLATVSNVVELVNAVARCAPSPDANTLSSVCILSFNSLFSSSRRLFLVSRCLMYSTAFVSTDALFSLLVGASPSRFSSSLPARSSPACVFLSTRRLGTLSRSSAIFSLRFARYLFSMTL